MTYVAVRTIREGRQLRVQPYNEYRKRFNLKPYTSFREFTGELTVDLQLLHFHESTCAYILGINGIHPIQARLFFEASQCLALLSLQWNVITLHKLVLIKPMHFVVCAIIVVVILQIMRRSPESWKSFTVTLTLLNFTLVYCWRERDQVPRLERASSRWEPRSP